MGGFSYKGLNYADKGIDLPGLPVPIADLPFYPHLFLPAVHRLDQPKVETINKTPADLSRPGQFVFVGI